jgi:DNA-binding CsgD family transcriptional regulator
MPNIEHHICLSGTEDVRAICQPLFANSCINYFDYDRYYDDNTWCSLSTDRELTQHYIEDQLYATAQEVSEATDQVKFAMLSHSVPLVFDDKRYIDNIDLGTRLNIQNRIYIPFRQQGYCEVFGFGNSGTAYELMDFYINHEDLVDNFILYFRQKAHKLIQEAAQTKILLPVDHIIHQTPRSVSITNTKDILKQIKMRRYTLSAAGKSIVISHRECQCLSRLKTNYTVKMIAQELELSPRTIESYIDSLRNKTGYNTKHDLIKLAQDNNL